jgi:hypothetical protein
MVWDPRSGSAIQAPQTGETVDFTRYNDAQHPNVWSDQVGIFRVPVPAHVSVRFPPGTAQPADDGAMGAADPAADQAGGSLSDLSAAFNSLPPARTSEEGSR